MPIFKQQFHLSFFLFILKKNTTADTSGGKEKEMVIILLWFHLKHKLTKIFQILGFASLPVTCVFYHNWFWSNQR